MIVRQIKLILVLSELLSDRFIGLVSHTWNASALLADARPMEGKINVMSPSQRILSHSVAPCTTVVFDKPV